MMSLHEKHTILVIGGGVAGLIAALDCGDAGHDVHLVDKAEHLGGQVANLDKVYPTDHCAFCPLWTDIKKVRDHGNITVYISSEVKEITEDGDRYRASITTNPLVIDERLCVFCGRCLNQCPAGAVRPTWEHACPPLYFIDKEVCTDCGDCLDVCPTGAIDLHRSEEGTALTVDQVIWATGFKEVDLSPFPEFGSGTHADIMTSLEFETWTAEAGSNRGTIIRKSNGEVPKTIAFIQCAGARDTRMLSYCSAVCCMHALKQAQWVRRRNPLIDCCIFYTDLRTVGRDYYEYSLREFEGSGIRLIRGRPGLIHPLPGGEAIAVKYEDTETQKREMKKFDMVVLNGNLASSMGRSISSEKPVPALTEEGFVDSANNDLSRFACGFTLEPADIAESVIQASAAAVQVSTKRKIVK